jgi:hypothetical protein
VLTAEAPARHRWEFWALLALAFVVRFYGLRFGMPHVQARPDELVVIGVGKDFLSGDLNPKFFRYPSLFMYVLAVCDYAYYVYGRAMGWFGSLEHFLSTFPVHWVPFFMIARVISAVAGTATVAAVYATGARLFDRLTAGLAAFFLALAFLHVRDSHFGVTDVSMTLCVTLSTLFLVRGALENRRMPFAIAGALAGAGASIKYNAVLMFVPLVTAVLVGSKGGRTRFHGGPEGKRGTAPFLEAANRAGLFGGLFTAAFVAGTPFAVLDWRAFIRDVAAESTHIGVPHSFDLGYGGVYHVVFSLRYGLGLPLLTTGLVGFAWLAKVDWRKAALLLAFPVAYYLLLVPTRTVFVRYAIPLVPFLCLAAAWAIARAARVAAMKYRMPAAALACTASLVVVAPSVRAVGQLDRLFAATDSRVLLADWLRANVKPGSSIYVAGSVVVQPIVDFSPPQTLRYWTHRDGRSFAEGRPQRPVAGIPDWLVIPDSGVPEYSYCPPEVKELANERYVAVRVFNAMDLDGNIFDRQDAFYYPYAGFKNIQRGGPNYVVYARKPENPD